MSGHHDQYRCDGGGEFSEGAASPGRSSSPSEYQKPPNVQSDPSVGSVHTRRDSGEPDSIPTDAEASIAPKAFVRDRPRYV